MANYDEKLNELRKKMARKKHLERVVDDLEKQRPALKQKMWQLESAKDKEEKDVKKIEGGSLYSLFYMILGQKDNKMEKEKVEAYVAKVKYDEAYAEFQALDADIEKIRIELRSLQFCEEEYQKLWKEKQELIKFSNSVSAEEIHKLEKQITYLSSQETEIQEAITVGNSTLFAASNAMECLDSAYGWSTWDLFGGGLIADVAKHNKLDEAQNAVQTLQNRLRRFKSELADVSIHTDVEVKIEGFLHFADYFFDGLIVDWMVRDKINQSQISIENIYAQIKSVLGKLKEMLAAVQSEKEVLQNKMDKIVLNSK